jgi:hypothetical protein
VDVAAVPGDYGFIFRNKSMAASGSPAEGLAQLSLRRLRQLANRLGIGPYSGMLKRQLVLGIQSRISNANNPAVINDPGCEAAELEVNPAWPNLQSLEAQLSKAVRPTGATRVVFLPRDPQWAYVFWEIGELDLQAAQLAGARELALRLADVTGCQAGSAHPHALQEVVVDSAAREWFLPVPLSGREYRVELGFRKATGGWISLAFSSIARMPELEPCSWIDDQFVAFSLDPVPPPASIAPASTSMVAGMHERLFQQSNVAGGTRVLARGSEAFHELQTSAPTAAGGQLSGVGPWASGLNESGAGLAARQRSFWLIADAELIVYGATDPAASLSIGDRVVPLEADGSFRLQVPFQDGQQVYPIHALAADGEQRRSISMVFSRTTPEARVNSREAAVAEWF